MPTFLKPMHFWEYKVSCTHVSRPNSLIKVSSQKIVAFFVAVHWFLWFRRINKLSVSRFHYPCGDTLVLTTPVSDSLVLCLWLWDQLYWCPNPVLHSSLGHWSEKESNCYLVGSSQSLPLRNQKDHLIMPLRTVKIQVIRTGTVKLQVIRTKSALDFWSRESQLLAVPNGPKWLAQMKTEICWKNIFTKT